MLHQQTTFISPQHEHRLLGLVLISLHLALWVSVHDFALRTLFFIHFSVFLLWQPLWEKRNPPSLKNIILLSGSAVIFLVYLNLWLITFWQLVLLGLLGGRDLAKPQDRLINIVAIIFICLQFFTVNIPSMFIFGDLAMTKLSFSQLDWLNYCLLAIPALFLLFPADNSAEHRYHIDFFHGLIVTLILIIVGLGSLTMMYHQGNSYPLAIFQMSFATTFFIFTVSWLWVIFENKTSIDELWTRHLLNIGSSFELWLENLAQPQNYKGLTPREYLESALEKLTTLPWVQGISWHSVYGENMLGSSSGNQLMISTQSLEVTVYSRYRISASHSFLIKLLVQLVEHFHQAKRREEAFAQQVHLQVIHETGAKLTHDIKNLLQSLQAISSVIESSQPNQFGDTQRLLQGQMPHLTQRLKRTLDKLQKPTELPYTTVPLTLWWGNLKARYAKRNISFVEEVKHNHVLIPEDLFDNVVENILQNALSKRKREPDLQIEVSLYADDDKLRLTVCDDGTAIAEQIADTLMMQPVASKDGFGIGLYQMAKQLMGSGYQVSLCRNIAGEVCFELVNAEEDDGH
ncbi:MAG: ATP-binding protein [Thiotrichaceae bacterium]|nr:ATP-binding protein [Thiotrichaceae bacterium]